jgi:hypothetical protein
MAPDTRQNILYAIYFLITHNAEALFYALCIIVTTILAIFKPTRGKIFIMWGFIILLFAFEYNKHILEPLRQQTITSLITERQSHRIEHTINYTLTRVLPKGLPIAGWMLVIFGFFFDKITHIVYKQFKKII